MRYMRTATVALMLTSSVEAAAPVTQYGPFGRADAVIFDAKTTLVWERGATPVSGFDDANLRCAALTLDSKRFRLPTAKELLSLADESPAFTFENGTLVPVAIDRNAFPLTVASLFWSASRSPQDASAAWTVDFHDGSSLVTSMSTPGYCRCVAMP